MNQTSKPIMRIYLRKWILKISFIGCVLYLLIMWKGNDENKNFEIVEFKAWPRNTSRDAKLYILPYKETSIILPTEICKKNTTLLIIVYSYIKNYAQRAAIRETWGSRQNISVDSIRIYFLLGQSFYPSQRRMDIESQMYDDIIQEHFIDSYYNLTIKSLRMLKIVNLYCINTVKFIMKVDDDTYVNLGPLIDILKNETGNNLLMGYMFTKGRVVRDLKHKSYAPYYLYSQDVYPDFLSGTGYLISVDLIPRLYAASLETPFFHLEDVYITGMLAQHIFVKPIHNKRFFVPQRDFLCQILTAFTSHSYDENDLRELHFYIKNCDIPKHCKMSLSLDYTYPSIHICSCNWQF